MRVNESRVVPPALPSEATLAGAAAPKAAVIEPSPFAQVLQGLGQQVTSGETTMRRAITARSDLGPAELIALQANVYRYSEAIDLASRLVDHATSGVKTVIQGAGQ